MGAFQFDLSKSNEVRLQSDYYRNLPSCDFLDFAVLFINLKKRGQFFALYKNLLDHFYKYQLISKKRFKTNQIGREDIDDFVRYLHIEKGLKFSTIKSMITKLKYLIEKAYLNGWAVDDSYSDARVIENDSTFVYLTEKEIARIYYYKGLTSWEEEIRDTFIVGCMTGQRYSDYSRLSSDNIKGDNIHILQQKTKNKAVVPLTDYVREIFAKYGGKMPKARCIQYFDKAIKNVCKKIGLDDLIVYEEERAGEIVMIKRPKYEMISSHTARRSFVTNMNKNNVPSEKTRKCTGHKSTACFDRYDKMTLEDNARSLAGNGYLA